MDSDMTIYGVDFSGACEGGRAPIPLWEARIRISRSGGDLEALEQLCSRCRLRQRIINSGGTSLWGIDAPFGLPGVLVPNQCDMCKPLWSPTNFPVFRANRDQIRVSGKRRCTDKQYPGTLGPWSLRLKPMTYQAIKLLWKLHAEAQDRGVFPWAPQGRVFEVFPGAAARALEPPGVTTNSYKHGSQKAILLRRRMVARLGRGRRDCFPPLRLGREHKDFCIGSDDALDAVLAALCVYWHTEHGCVAERHKKEADGAWRLEGLIVGPGARTAAGPGGEGGCDGGPGACD